ncbi:MAG TPA: IclR family transcriptional regulator [Candidatus Binatia bacterium]|nr:IclR family transcriptional regulator [Candidatus Binatia bacterium]
MRREKTNYTIQSVSHALDVIEQFNGERDELGVTELSKRLKLHKNNVFRLLATLEARGYIEQNKATDNYRLGIRCLQLGQSYLGQIGLLHQARAILESVAHTSHEMAFVAVLRRGVVVPLDAVESDQSVRLVSRVGDALPLHCTAAGKLHLAFASEDELRELLGDEVVSFTERTITERAVLAQKLKAIAAQGYATEIGEHLTDVTSVAAPVRDYTRNVVGTLTISAPSYRMSDERIKQEAAPLIVKAAGDLSTRLGFRP